MAASSGGDKPRGDRLPPRILPQPTGPTKKRKREAQGPRASSVVVPMASEEVRRSNSVSSQSAQRFAEREKARLRRARRPWIIVFSVIVVGAVAAWIVFGSSMLAVSSEHIEVSGVSEVVDANAVDAVVKSAEGVPLARVDTDQLGQRLEKVRGVRWAAVARSWPQGLRVAIEARAPVAAVPSDDGTYTFLDADAVTVGTAKAAPQDLPTISVPLKGDANTQRSLKAALSVLESIPEELRTQIASISAQTPDRVQFVLRNKVTVVWGSADETALKIRVLEVLRAKDSSAKVIDVSAPRNPVTR